MARLLQNPQGPGSGLRTVEPGSVNSAENIQRELNPEPTLPAVPPSGAEIIQRQAVPPQVDIPPPLFKGLSGVRIQDPVTDTQSLVEGTGNPYLV